MAEATEFEMDPVTYQELEQLEDDFEDVELEMIRQQYNLSKDLHARREKVVAKIPHFWPLVIEQSPPDIDEYIQPTDAALLMNSLTGISVERFELPNGDPRSIAITWSFSENEHFEDSSVTKKFYWRNAKDGWGGLVSEPVTLKWKEGKDLTNGMLDLVKKVYDEEAASGKPDQETESKKKLKAQMESTGLDGLSFFAWFGFRGRKISDAEHQEATKVEQEKRQKRKAGEKVDDDEMDEDDEDDDDDEYEWEIFPTADDLAVCIAEDLWPNAIKYFMQAQEQDALSDIDFEDASDEEMEDGDDSKDENPTKKRKA